MNAVVLTLVLGCIGEIDLPEQPDECLKMWHIQGAKVDYQPELMAKQMRGYNAVFKSRTPRSKWILELTLAGQRPNSFPAHLSWERRMRGMGYSRQQSVIRIITAAYIFLEADTVHPCPEATHYGAPTDKPPACAVPVWCGHTKQRYWSYKECRWT